MELLLIDFGHVLKTIYAETDKKTLQPVRYLYVYEWGQIGLWGVVYRHPFDIVLKDMDQASAPPRTSSAALDRF